MMCVDTIPAWFLEVGALTALLLGFFAGRAYTRIGMLFDDWRRRRSVP